MTPDPVEAAVEQAKKGKVNPTVIGVVIIAIVFLIQAGFLPSKDDIADLTDAITEQNEELTDDIHELEVELTKTRAALERFQAVYDERESHGEDTPE